MSNSTFFQTIPSLPGLSVQENIALSSLTTMSLGGPVTGLLQLESDFNIESLPLLLNSIEGEVRFLGAGSNIIAADEQHDFVVLKKTATGKPRILEESEEGVLLRVDAGLRLSTLVSFASKHGFLGFEGLSGIPSAVSGALWMNAGSYGQSISDSLQTLYVADKKGLHAIKREDCQVAYRSFRIPSLGEQYFIYQADFYLKKGDANSIGETMRSNYAKKRLSQPVSARCAGCVFKNPSQGPSAGVLLDTLGYKGKSRGGMSFSTQHANFLINDGSGNFSDALFLIEDAREAVLKSTGTTLELEVRIWR